MDPRNGGERRAVAPSTDAEAIEFVRFCYRRKRVGWPELYDEMCLVAGRGAYNGYGPEELASIGIGLGLFEMPTLAGLVSRVVAEDVERRRRSADAVRAAVAVVAEPSTAHPAPEPAAVPGASTPDADSRPEPVETGVPGHGTIRIAVAAGA